jgi:hypothetical protein
MKKAITENPGIKINDLFKQKTVIPADNIAVIKTILQ